MQDFYVSNTLLTLLDQSPTLAYNKLTRQNNEDDDIKAFRIGSAVDTLLTEPHKWDDRFEVLNVYKPYGLMGKFVSKLPKDLTPYSDSELYKEAYDASGYKIEIAKVISNFWKNPATVSYYQYVNNADEEKTILSLDEYDTVVKMKSSITDSPYASKYFNEDAPAVYQLKIIFPYKNHKVKCYLDGVLYDHNKKTALPFDLKTTSWKGPFDSSYVDKGYFRQGALYTKALRYYLDDTGMSEYEVLPFQFIVAQVVYDTPYPASIWQMSEADLKAGMEGKEVNGVYYKGVDELIDQLDWHIQTDWWSSDKESYENGGVRLLTKFE